MIAFDLLCTCGYQFEGWFPDSESFQSQVEAKLLECPQCGGSEVRKILSPVLVRTGSATRPAKTDRSEAGPAAVLQALQEYVEKNFQDVGSNLATEALKIHYGLAEARNIRGIATSTEEETLKKEGIALLKVPLPPKNEKAN